MRPGCIAAIGAILGIIIGLYLKSIALLLCVGFIIIIYIKHNKNIRILMFFIIIFSVYVCYLENNYLEIKKTYNKQQIRIQGIIISMVIKRNIKHNIKFE